MPYSRRESQRRYGKFAKGVATWVQSNGELGSWPLYYSVKAAIGCGPGRQCKRQWCRDVRNAFKQEMAKYRDDFDRISITRENRIKDYWSWI